MGQLEVTNQPHCILESSLEQCKGNTDSLVHLAALNYVVECTICSVLQFGDVSKFGDILRYGDGNTYMIDTSASVNILDEKTYKSVGHPKLTTSQFLS